MDNIVSVKLDSRYASTLGVWQYDYGQVLRITGPELPPAVEVQFSLDEKSGETLSRVGTTVDGVTEVKIPDELLRHSATSNYRIYAYIYLTDETSGNTKCEITIPVRVRSKPTSPAEDPETDPDLFRGTVVAVNASAERAENAASSAMKSAASADETLAEIKRVADGISGNIENANTMKSELSDMINNAGIEKKELESSIGKAGEAKTALDGSTNTAGEMQETLSATVKQAGALDTSLGEKIETGTQLNEDITASGEKAVQDIQAAGSEQLDKMQAVAEEFTADREQITKNKEDIGSLKEDISNKITKFYASNQGETHLADSDKGLVQDIKIYGQSEQSSTTGAQLFNENIEIKNRGVTIKINGSTATFKGTVSDEANARVNYQKNIKLKPGKYTASSSNEKIKADFLVEKANNETIYNDHIEIDGTEKVKIRVLFGLKPSAKGDVINETTNIMLNDGDIALPYEPYTGGQPSPSPEYPQEIKSVVNPVVKVCGKNLLSIQNETLSKNGVTIVFRNGIGILNGTLDNDGYIQAIGTFMVKETGEYYISSAIANNPHEPRIIIKINNDSYISAEKGLTKILNIGDVVTLYVRISTPGTYNNIVIKPMIIHGTSATYDDFEPYHEEQTVTLPYTLNAIPVSSGGNVTIDGQQYIADYVDVERGKLVRMCERKTFNTKNGRIDEEYRLALEISADNAGENGDKECIFSTFKWTSWETCVAGTAMYIKNIKKSNNELYTAQELKELSLEFDIIYQLLEPQETDLTTEEIAAFKALTTYYPTTNISVNSEQLDGYTVFNYPISMANGWNYVKKQLNDNRDYIYDMDLQSAEAYVNSEYAVALTELEV